MLMLKDYPKMESNTWPPWQLISVETGTCQWYQCLLIETQKNGNKNYPNTNIGDFAQYFAATCFISNFRGEIEGKYNGHKFPK